MIGDFTLRWIITALFGVSTATYVYLLVAQRDRSTSTIDHLLHLTMAAAMILMTWHIGADFPTAGPMLFFLVAGAWFVRAASRVSSATGARLTNSYYAVMAAAMVWMYAMMSGNLAGQAGHQKPDSLAMKMPGTEMPGHEMPRATPGFGWVTTINWVVALGFAVAALYWSSRCAARRQAARLEPLYQACAAAGTAAMFFAQV